MTAAPRHNVVAEAVITDDLGRWLLVLGQQNWRFPGGLVRLGESPAASVRRKVRAETGIDLPTVNPLLVAGWVSPRPPVKYGRMVCVFGAGPVSSTVPIMPGRRDVRWTPADEAVRLLPPDDVHRIASTRADGLTVYVEAPENYATRMSA
jgi:ADP-ribose pyrophosphatase YjhB (NUDIX family)